MPTAISETRHLIDLPLLKTKTPKIQTKKRTKPNNKIRRSERTAEEGALFKYPIEKSLLFQPVSAEDSFTLLRQYMTPVDERSVLIVSIDFEFTRDNEITEIGISTLDTQEFQNSEHFSLKPITRNYRCVLKKFNKVACLQANLDHDQSYHPDLFLWGKSECLPSKQIAKLLEETLQPTTATGEHRNVILVVHCFLWDMNLMHKLGIDLSDKQRFSGLLGLIDTQDMACALIKPKDVLNGREQLNHFKLSHLLDYLGVLPYHLHTAGNDANLTMKALLLMACAKFQVEDLTRTEKEVLSKFILVSREHRPSFLSNGAGASRGVPRAEWKSMVPEDWSENMDDSGIGILIFVDA